MIVQNGQDVFDVSLSVGGSIEYAFEVAALLSVGVTSTELQGKFINFRSILTNPQKRVLQIYKEKKVNPASNVQAGLQGEGIGFWFIGLDFRVS